MGGGGGGSGGGGSNASGGGSALNAGVNGQASCANCWAQVPGGNGGANTGGGGGGGSHYNSNNKGGDGGSGIVIVRYLTNTVIDATLVVNSSGNVGIGTTAPTQKLDVAGTVKATAFIGDGSGLTGISTQKKIWSGGCNYHGTAGGWNMYCANSTDFNAAGSHLSVKANGTFTVLVAGYYRVNYWGLN